MVDLFAILPTYIEVALGGGGEGLAVLRILRMARIIRVVKVGTFKENLILVGEGLRRSVTGLLLLVYLVIIFMVVMSSVMFTLEHEGQPDVFIDIPHTFWFTIVTMTSVGYGDMYPITATGRCIGAIIMLSGILTLAVPITLISNKFNAVWLEAKSRKRKEKTIYDLIHGVTDETQVVDEDDDTGKMSAVNSRLFTANLLMKQSFEFTSDERFSCAMYALRAAGAPRPTRAHPAAA